MYRLILAISIVVCWFGPTVSIAQTRKNDQSEVLKQLLALPAPTPRTSSPADTEQKPRTGEFFARKNQPPDDAPIIDLVTYWERWIWIDNRPKPSDTVIKRLRDYFLTNPEGLARFIRLFPATEETISKMKELYDRSATDEKYDPPWRDAVKNWLVFNSDCCIDELLTMARKAKDSKNGEVNKVDALVALAKLDWTNAEPLLRSLMGSGQPRSSTLALSLLYSHAAQENDSGAAENYRRMLQQIAVNAAQPGYARFTAIQALALSEWSGRDEWYLNLFQDESILSLEDGNSTYAPLITLFQSDPEKWIPAVARLLESKEMTVRIAAASCLMVFKAPDARKDALLPLLPWLSNPAWITDKANERVQLIQTLGFIDVPESVPGLIAAVESKDEPPYTRSYAGLALARYEDPRAAPALKKALATERDEGNRQRLLGGLVASGGLPDEEGLEALEAYIVKARTPEGQALVNEYAGQITRLELPVSIGKFLSMMQEAPASLVRTVLARAENLKKQDPAMAQSLLEIAHRWQGPQVDLDMINRIANGTADAKMISSALGRRQNMVEKHRPELEGLAAASGIAPGIGAVMLDDAYLAQSVLASGEESTQAALLACSRLMQTPLPVDVVGSFLGSKNKLLAQAAELYLLANDSQEARALLWRHHPNEAYITGWREAAPVIMSGSLDAMAKMEEKLRAELFKEHGPVEIFALISSDEPYSRVLRVYRDKAVYTDYEDPARYRERTVPAAEVSAFKDKVTANGLLELGPNIEWCHHGCTAQQFLAISKEKGRRVFSQIGFIDNRVVIGLFDDLGVGPGIKTHYNVEKEIKGLEVLFDDPELTALDVWQQDGQLRLYIERPEEEEEPQQSTNSDDDEDEDRSARFLEEMRRDITRDRARYSWRVFANDKLGDVTLRPDGYSVVDPVKFVAEEVYDADSLDEEAVLLTPDSIIQARGSDGLWKQFAGAKPVQIGEPEHDYRDAVVTPDRKWLVVSKSPNDGSGTQIVRMNLQTGREFKVKLETADELAAITFIPNVGKVLVQRQKGEYVSEPTGPDHAEYYLLDAATGETRAVTGEFEPLLQGGYRFLQHTDKPDEYWAAIPDQAKDQTRVGRYNVRDFSFKQVMIVPRIEFDSMTMWVDAKQEKVYVVYKGQLLRLRLQTEPTTARD
ncbi:MAG TPA: HEAT repeat domain-containing protein [Pyrinomonadaceae bacterium]|nr:HEAT repeat domain-containing protein [Pyrinomonadaceae bacterium]